MSLGVVVLLELVHVQHEHHHLGLAIQQLQLHIAAEGCVVQKACQRIPAVGVLPVFQPNLSLVGLRLHQGLHGVGFGNVHDDHIRALCPDGGVEIDPAKAENVNIPAVLPADPVLQILRGIFGNACVEPAQILRAFLLGNQVGLPHFPALHIRAGVARHFLEVFIGFHNPQITVQGVAGIGDGMDVAEGFRLFRDGGLSIQGEASGGGGVAVHVRNLHFGMLPEHLNEFRDNEGVKLTAGAPAQLGNGGLRVHGPAVGAIVGHGVIGIHHGNDPAEQGNALPAQAVGITGAVPALVMMADFIGNAPELIVAVGNFVALDRMGFQNGPLVGGQLAGLVENFQRNADFADVMEQAQQGQLALLMIGQVNPLAKF